MMKTVAVLVASDSDYAQALKACMEREDKSGKAIVEIMKRQITKSKVMTSFPMI